ncbi:MAG: MarR family transcriptional regulator [Chloroflexi bacterium]|nr:MarR family transcriptional regulator [Chloroflexota bacterium]
MANSRLKEEKLDYIVDGLLLFFPLFYRRLLRVAQSNKHINPINMQFQVLSMVISSGELQISEIGRRLGVSKPNMTPLIDRLIEKAYAARLSDGKDRRVIRIKVTEKGRRFVLGRKRLAKNQIKKSLSDLSLQEIETMSAAMETFKQVVVKVGTVQ